MIDTHRTWGALVLLHGQAFTATTHRKHENTRKAWTLSWYAELMGPGLCLICLVSVTLRARMGLNQVQNVWKTEIVEKISRNLNLPHQSTIAAIPQERDLDGDDMRSGHVHLHIRLHGILLR